MRRSDGYTLLELLITLAIAGVLLGVARPGMNRLVAHNHRVVAANSLIASLQLARSEAHKRGVEVVLCPSQDQAHCDTGAQDWQNGWLVFADHSPTRPRQVESGDEILLVRQRHRRVTVRANRPVFVLRPHYRRSSNGTFSVCPVLATAAPVALIVSYTGRPRLSPTQPDGTDIDCPPSP